MYSGHCGTEATEDARFCPSCGGEQDRQNPADSSAESRQLVGYSQRITDPRVAAVLKKISSSGMTFTFILAVIAFIGFTGAGAAEVGGFALPSAMYMGLGFGGLLVAIGLIQKARTKKDITWDGAVIDKKIKEPTYRERQSGNYQTQYLLSIRRDDGRTKIVSSTKELYDYFQIGDHIRHHGGTPAHIFEKYDKSRDSVIFCIACTSKNDIGNDLCYRCKCPLLK